MSKITDPQGEWAAEKGVMLPDPEGGCFYCGGGDAVELAAGQGVHVEGKAFHTECVLAWGESQGFTADEMDALSEQAFG